MTKLRNILIASTLAAAAILALAADAIAQTGKMPIPSNVCQGSGRPMVSAAGSVTGTYDQMTCATTLSGITSLTVGASGTALTQIKTYSTTVAPSSVAAGGCADQNVTLAGIATTDFLVYRATLVSPALVRVKPSTGSGAIILTYCNPGNSTMTPHTFTLDLIATSI